MQQKETQIKKWGFLLGWGRKGGGRALQQQQKKNFGRQLCSTLKMMNIRSHDVFDNHE